MLGDNAPVLADYDAIGIGMNLDRTPDRTGRHRVLVVVEAHQAGLRDGCRHRVESIEPAGIGNEPRPTFPYNWRSDLHGEPVAPGFVARRTRACWRLAHPGARGAPLCGRGQP